MITLHQVERAIVAWGEGGSLKEAMGDEWKRLAPAFVMDAYRQPSSVFMAALHEWRAMLALPSDGRPRCAAPNARSCVWADGPRGPLCLSGPPPDTRPKSK